MAQPQQSTVKVWISLSLFLMVCQFWQPFKSPHIAKNDMGGFWGDLRIVDY
jgi:hypothetical protein